MLGARGVRRGHLVPPRVPRLEPEELPRGVDRQQGLELARFPPDLDAGERAAVAPAADRVRKQAERVRPLVEAHETELPRAMLEAWDEMSGAVRSLGKP